MIRGLVRWVGALLLLAGVGLLARDLLALLHGDPFRPEALGSLWHLLDAASLEGLQAAIQRHLGPAVWDNGVMLLLLQPAFAVAVVVGALLLLVAPARARHRGLR